MDVICVLLVYNVGCDFEWLCLKFVKMCCSFFVFLCGLVYFFYVWFECGFFKWVLVVWCCGDMYLENFGSY